MFDYLKQLDTELFLYLNALCRNSFFDFVMWWASNRFIWIPFYAWLLYLLWKKYPKRFWVLLISIALMILVTDQLCDLAKTGIKRFRPTHELAIAHLVHTINNYRGGLYGFYSGHATNAFAVGAFTHVLLRKSSKWVLPVMLVYLILVPYSRIYLGVHYPGDVLVGALVGSVIGWFFGWRYKQFYAKHVK